MRYALAALLLCLFAAQAEADDEHIIYPSTEGSMMTPADFTAHFEREAQKFRKERPGSQAVRYVTCDMVFPTEGAEYEAFGHQAVLLVGAASHDPSELPLARVYIRSGNRVVELKRIQSTMRSFGANSDAASVFGETREDSFYLVPVDILGPDAELLADFATHRAGFSIGAPPAEAPAFTKGDIGTGITPAPEVLRAFLDREYPGFAQGAPP